MNKQQLDELYHLLRIVSNDAASPDRTPNYGTALTPTEEGSRIFGLARHLLSAPDYAALVQYLAMYGELYLLEPTASYIYAAGLRPSRIVELGAGLSWLGRGLASRFNNIPTLLIDKRRWALIDEAIDLETPPGLAKLRSLLKSEDLIVMADLLHCINNPRELIDELGDFSIAILEYYPIRVDYWWSYEKQLRRYGASPFSPGDLERMFSSRIKGTANLDPYILFILDPITQIK